MQVILELEEQLSNVRQIESERYQSELKKYKLRYEIMARNEVNHKLSEINDFLEQRAQEQTKTTRERESIMENIQKDLNAKLKQSRDELSAIKKQMNGTLSQHWTCLKPQPRTPVADTLKGVKSLQSQLKAKEQELQIERNLRRQLEKYLGPEEVEKVFLNDYVKPFAYF